MGKVIGVMSLKGGVGKTSAITALGDAISGFKKKVILVDGNLSAPNLAYYLNVQPEITLQHVLARDANLNQAIYNLENFDIIPSSVSYRTKINPLFLRDRIKPLKKSYDIVLIDSSPALNEETLAVILASDELLFITTPDHPTLETTLKSIKAAQQRGTPVIGLIINKVYNKNFELSVKEIEETSNVPVLAVVPHDIKVLEALSRSEPSTQNKPKSEASIEYKKLGALLIGEKYKPFRLKDVFGRRFRRQEINREIYYERLFED